VIKAGQKLAEMLQAAQTPDVTSCMTLEFRDTTSGAPSTTVTVAQAERLDAQVSGPCQHDERWGGSRQSQRMHWACTHSGMLPFCSGLLMCRSRHCRVGQAGYTFVRWKVSVALASGRPQQLNYTVNVEQCNTSAAFLPATTASYKVARLTGCGRDISCNSCTHRCKHLDLS
jgi:hypothetical protein